MCVFSIVWVYGYLTKEPEVERPEDDSEKNSIFLD